MDDVITAPALDAGGRLAHGFFTRSGGVSEGLFRSLNCGPGSGDDKVLVAENRARVAGRLGADASRLLTAWQIHSATAIEAREPWPMAGEDRPKADGIVTATPGLAIGVLTADCAPILFADPHARVVGAAHAGWRGALGGVIEATVAAMERLGARRATIAAALGPTIGPENYEVGEEFVAEFTAGEPGNARFFRRHPGRPKPTFDLPAFVLSRLEATGIGTVENRTQCTYASESRFFSFRRSTHRKEPDYGRQISAIVIK